MHAVFDETTDNKFNFVNKQFFNLNKLLSFHYFHYATKI